MRPELVWLAIKRQRIRWSGYCRPFATIWPLKQTRFGDANFTNHLRIRQSGKLQDNADNLAQFLSITDEKARDIATTNHLYSD